jgi:hypothetical protein
MLVLFSRFEDLVNRRFPWCVDFGLALGGENIRFKLHPVSDLRSVAYLLASLGAPPNKKCLAPLPWCQAW